MRFEIEGKEKTEVIKWELGIDGDGCIELLANGTPLLGVTTSGSVVARCEDRGWATLTYVRLSDYTKEK
jgi:hypothetical protein